MASANRTKRQLSVTNGPRGAVSLTEYSDHLDEIPFLDDTAPAFTGAPTIGGLGIVTGTATNIARTATVAGATTGLIADGAGRLQVYLITATDANHIIILPTPVVGTIVVLCEVSTVGYELRTNTPASIGINGGVGSAAESAIPASTTVVLVCETATNWKGFQMSSTAGTLAKVEVAAP